MRIPLLLLALAQQDPATMADTTARLVLVEVIMRAEGGLSLDRVVDVAVAGDGTIYALTAQGTITQIDSGTPHRTWGGRGASRGKFRQPQAIAVGPSETIYVFDGGLNTISVFDSTGTFLQRGIAPMAFVPFYSLDVDSDGRIYIGAFGDEAPGAQIHVLCPDIECHLRSLGELRPTKDPDAQRFFQSGFIDVGKDEVLFAGLNPFRVERYYLKSGDVETLVKGDLLPDAEPIAFDRTEEDHFTITNWFPQTTGLARMRDGSFVYTAFFPDEARSVLELYDPTGQLKGKSEVPAHMRVEGTLPNGDIVLLRQLGHQEIAVYRFEETQL